jgi:hypothetical protein
VCACVCGDACVHLCALVCMCALRHGPQLLRCAWVSMFTPDRRVVCCFLRTNSAAKKRAEKKKRRKEKKATKEAEPKVRNRRPLPHTAHTPVHSRACCASAHGEIEEGVRGDSSDSRVLLCVCRTRRSSRRSVCGRRRSSGSVR